MATKPSLKKKQKAYSKASKARKLRSTAEAAERNNYSGKISEKKATRMKKKATKLYAASKKAHNTSGMSSAKDVANRAKYNAAKKKKEAAKDKEPLNYGTPMNYSMKPGSREKDSPGAFRDTPINKYMGSPVNYGTESPINDSNDKKKAALEKARKAREEFQSKNPGAKLNVKTKQPVKPKTELKTTVKGDLPSGGYSEAQKKKAIAQMKADAAKKKKGIK